MGTALRRAWKLYQRWILAGLATAVAGPWVWSGLASYIFVKGMGHPEEFEFPYLQIWEEFIDIRDLGLPHGIIALNVLLQLGLALILATLPFAVCGKLLYRRMRRPAPDRPRHSW